MNVMNSPLERGCARICCGGGVLADMFVNTPLHPSQEGNRTGRALKYAYFFVPAGSFSRDPAPDACVKHQYDLQSIIHDVPALCSAGSSATDLAGTGSFAGMESFHGNMLNTDLYFPINN